MRYALALLLLLVGCESVSFQEQAEPTVLLSSADSFRVAAQTQSDPSCPIELEPRRTHKEYRPTPFVGEMLAIKVQPSARVDIKAPWYELFEDEPFGMILETKGGETRLKKLCGQRLPPPPPEWN